MHTTTEKVDGWPRTQLQISSATYGYNYVCITSVHKNLKFFVSYHLVSFVCTCTWTWSLKYWFCYSVTQVLMWYSIKEGANIRRNCVIFYTQYHNVIREKRIIKKKWKKNQNVYKIRFKKCKITYTLFLWLAQNFTKDWIKIIFSYIQDLFYCLIFECFFVFRRP